jgi:hypothetical protein
MQYTFAILILPSHHNKEGDGAADNRGGIEDCGNVEL